MVYVVGQPGVQLSNWGSPEPITLVSIIILTSNLGVKAVHIDSLLGIVYGSILSKVKVTVSKYRNEGFFLPLI